jgi:hypothetical protein
MSALRIRFPYTPGFNLAYRVTRQADGLYWDFGGATFGASPGTPRADLPPGTGDFVGLYSADLVTTSVLVQFPDGDYLVTVHDKDSSNQTIATEVHVLVGGDDKTVVASGSGSDSASIAASLALLQQMAPTLQAMSLSQRTFVVQDVNPRTTTQFTVAVSGMSAIKANCYKGRFCVFSAGGNADFWAVVASNTANPSGNTTKLTLTTDNALVAAPAVGDAGTLAGAGGTLARPN